MSEFKNIPVLITGGCGMVGSHLVDYYHSRNERVTATYFTQPTIDLEEVKSKANYIPCDVRDANLVEEIIAKYKPEIIFHLAAQSYPTVSWEKPAETIDTNVNGTINVFEAIKKYKKENNSYDPMVVIACSSAEYGAALTPENIPITEDAPLLPVHPYGVSKVGQDLLGFQYFMNDKIKNIRVRIFNTTGPRKINDVASDFTKRAVMWERGEVDVVEIGNLETERAITDVRDLVQALLLLSEKGTPGDVYNVCGKNAYKIQNILFEIENIIGEKLPIKTSPKLLRSTDEPIIFGDSTKLIQATKWEQQYSLTQTLRDMVKYWRFRLE